MSLSPAAQAVLDHFLADREISTRHGIAAALRAAADQVVPESWRLHQKVRHDLLAIACELKGSDD